MKLYHRLREDITCAAYKFGDKLPSKRVMAEQAGVSVITAQHAYSLLCDEGYAEAVERSGYFVTYRREDFVPVAEAEAVYEPNYRHRQEDFPFPTFAKTMRNVISEYGERLLVKPPNLGVVELRRALSDYLGRSKGVKATPEQIVIGSGAEYLYGLIVQLLGRDKVYATENPCYKKIQHVYRANGAVCDPLKMGKDGILSRELCRTAATVLHVTPFNSFPSGVTASASKRHEYIRWAQARSGIIIEDDFDSEFTVSTKHEDTLFSLNSERVIYLNTFSRTIAPSMRMGYMVLPKSLLEAFREKIGFYSCTVPAFEQYVLAEFITNGGFQRHINRVRRARRQALREK